MATAQTASFRLKHKVLSDGSSVWTLYLWNAGELVHATEMPTEQTALQCSDMLTRVLHRFLACRSDSEAVRFAIRIEDALTTKE